MKYPNGRRGPKNDGSKTGFTVIWAHERGDVNELTYFWRNRDDYLERGQTSCKHDNFLFMNAFEGIKLLNGKTLKENLIERGYDISTFKFTIEKL